MNPTVIRQSLNLDGFDPEHIAEIARGGRFEHYILTRAACQVRHQRWACGEFSVDIGCYSFPTRAIGAFSQDCLCLGYSRSITAPTYVNGFEVGTEAIQFYPAGTELNYRAARDIEWVAIEFTETALQQAALEQLGRGLNLPATGATNFHVPRAECLALDRMVQRSTRLPHTSRAMIAPILGAIAELLCHLQTDSLASLARQWHHREFLLNRADDFLLRHSDLPFDARVLAAAIGTTERTMQRLFLDAYGITPREWARCLALHHVRKRLLTLDSSRFSIDGIAHEYGFRHMGRFAGYYAGLFGECPSATFAQAI